MDIKCLETFIKISQLGSFTQVADIMHLSQPGVSKQIQRLESYLGVPLLRRNENGTQLTVAGRQVYQYGKEILGIWDSLIRYCNEVSGLVKGVLRIGASTIPAAHFLPTILASFHEMFHSVEISVQVCDSDIIMEKLRNDEIDLALVGKYPENQPDVWTTRVGSDYLVVVGPASDYRDQSSAENFDWLASPFILREPGSGTRFATEQILSELGVGLDKIRCVAVANDTQAILELVKKGVGLAIVSNLAVETAVQNRQLSIIFTLPKQRYFYAACPRRLLDNVLVQAFISNITDDDSDSKNENPE